MTTHRFKEITHPVTKSVPCRTCGKSVRRSTTFSQTVNPFNRDAEGNVKTTQQIRVELKRLAETWQPVNDIHGACVQAERDAQAAEAAS